MPSWGQILNEISQLAKTNQKAFDVIRQKYIKELFDYTKRNGQEAVRNGLRMFGL